MKINVFFQKSRRHSTIPCSEWGQSLTVHIFLVKKILPVPWQHSFRERRLRRQRLKQQRTSAWGLGPPMGAKYFCIGDNLLFQKRTVAIYYWGKREGKNKKHWSSLFIFINNFITYNNSFISIFIWLMILL